jgi:hypothetical protein
VEVGDASGEEDHVEWVVGVVDDRAHVGDAGVEGVGGAGVGDGVAFEWLRGGFEVGTQLLLVGLLEALGEQVLVGVVEDHPGGECLGGLVVEEGADRLGPVSKMITATR